MAELAYLLLLNATNTTNTTASDESFGVYDLLQEQCHTPPGLEFENAYGGLKSLLVVALAAITLLTFGEDAKLFVSWAFERFKATATKVLERSAATVTKGIDRVMGSGEQDKPSKSGTVSPEPSDATATSHGDWCSSAKSGRHRPATSGSRKRRCARTTRS